MTAKENGSAMPEPQWINPLVALVEILQRLEE
jgi:hypothetical protein